jgi:8-oxo-dGTP pyrophosphatase MutT (NUDIX family)
LVTEYVKRLRRIVGDDELLQIPSVSVALRDSDDRVLMARHSEGNVWLLPGGAVEPGEVPADAAVREMWEETGSVVRLTGLVGIFGGSDFIVHYRNGHRTSYVMAVFEAVVDGGCPKPDLHEVHELRYVSEVESRSLPMARWVPEVLQAVFRGQARGSFRQPAWSPPKTP